MNILLININPVVSRLLTLCTRDEHIVLDEVESASAVEKVSYDIVFVDETSYVDNVKALLEKLEARKKVFISYSGEAIRGFDETIKKPFLPSQIINIIESVDMADSAVSEETNSAEESISIFPLSTEDDEADDTFEIQENAATTILNSDEIERIKALLDMEEDELEVNEDAELLSDEEYEARKVKVIKEKLIADGLEIVEENEIIEALSKDNGDSFQNINKEFEKTKKSKKKSKKKKETEVSRDELAYIEEELSVVIANLKPKKIKKFLKGKKIKIKLEDNQ